MAQTKIPRDQVEHVAKLASLMLADDEADRLGHELGEILAYMASLDELDVAAVEPTFHSIPMGAPLRADEVIACFPRETYLKSAPKSEAGGFAVPKVLEGEG
ncbi:MAG: Asp-tRNA(Asn)/Glu-tRNA(Gln) amidotransferase subunit GatC [Myxococcales bacterium]|nr:Asp-tRNA(Asn)/Glu-tRNA(Gln) amidotransferase subunit GatC [Myxococcales bacterium]MDD9969886.1 Asp-tRNA(Asn)/Glu-tRNA(Gln) amidotransferase subunit GatC [Myxococcales bacterium]